MTVTHNFLGIPIDGDITRGDKRVPQRPLSELEPLIRAVLDDPTMHSFGWTQYTPYFNDGEPCVFGVNEPWFRTVEDVEKADRSARIQKRNAGIAAMRVAVDAGTLHPDVLARAEEDAAAEDEDDDPDYEDRDELTVGYSYGHPTLGKRERTFNFDTRHYDVGAYVGPDEDRYDRVFALSLALAGGAFEDVLLDAFGDHAEVTVTRDGITVREYSHD
jgi:hypothetical protein